MADPKTQKGGPGATKLKLKTGFKRPNPAKIQRGTVSRTPRNTGLKPTQRGLVRDPMQFQPSIPIPRSAPIQPSSQIPNKSLFYLGGILSPPEGDSAFPPEDSGPDGFKIGDQSDDAKRLAALAIPGNPAAELFDITPAKPAAPPPPLGAPADPAKADFSDFHGSAGTHAYAYDEAQKRGKIVPKSLYDYIKHQAQTALDPRGGLLPEELAGAARSFREWERRFNQGSDPARRDINNYAVLATYNIHLAAEAEDRNKGKRTGADVFDPNGPNAGLWNAFEGQLQGQTNDSYAPGFLIAEDENGFWNIKTNDAYLQETLTEARADPELAAELKVKLANWGAYPGAQEQYVDDDIVFDSSGYPIAAKWDKEDTAALRQFLNDAGIMQAGGDRRPWKQILDEVAEQNTDVLGNGAGFGGSGGGYRRYGGGGGWGGGGFGGGGGATGVSYTDADQLKQFINAVARARLGYTLTDAQVQEFVSYYHQQESAFVQARVAGQSAMQLDPESQAAAWIESRFRDAAAGTAMNNYVSQLANFLLGGGNFGSTS